MITLTREEQVLLKERLPQTITYMERYDPKAVEAVALLRSLQNRIETDLALTALPASKKLNRDEDDLDQLWA